MTYHVLIKQIVKVKAGNPDDAAEAARQQRSTPHTVPDVITVYALCGTLTHEGYTPLTEGQS